jgi:hypothetical protein
MVVYSLGGLHVNGKVLDRKDEYKSASKIGMLAENRGQVFWCNKFMVHYSGRATRLRIIVIRCTISLYAFKALLVILG